MSSSPIVMITGAAKGIGAATARLFASKGYRLVLTDIDMAELEKTRASIGGDALAIRHDVQSSAEWSAAFDTAEAAFGRVDVLVSNAGKLNCGFVMDLSPEKIREHFDINVMGVVNGLHAAFPRMKAQGRGHIVTIASIASFVPVTAMILATGPWIDSRIDWSGASHGIDDPAAWAGVETASVTKAPSASVEARSRRRDRAEVIGRFLRFEGKRRRGGIRRWHRARRRGRVLRGGVRCRRAPPAP